MVNDFVLRANEVSDASHLCLVTLIYFYLQTQSNDFVLLLDTKSK